jgi:hypothetical protein
MPPPDDEVESLQAQTASASAAQRVRRMVEAPFPDRVAKPVLLRLTWTATWTGAVTLR